ncbi:hypothetical protein [Desulforamulus reducens]|uniref:hypothetical protein n=1 Tax=Desulforamulus reducens TaxID=59610 RepID=UPI0002E9D648|nr:hypothetical protein [Desulforamulus reducens]
MIIDKKITFEVTEITDKGSTVLLKFIPTMPEGTTWDSPSDPLFVTVPKDQNILSVGDVFDGPVIAQYDDGVVE